MLSPRLFALPWTLALALSACDSRPDPAQQPPVAEPTPPAPEPAPATDPAAEEHYNKALEYEAAGRYVEAKIEIDQALEAGAGRDAKLLAAKLAILRNDLDAASNILTPLAADKNDALVQYNLGLIAQTRKEYNRARSAYLAAAKADPNYAPVRFNLAILTWDNGVKDEAQHHARKFLELAPNDPRALELRARVGLDPALPPAAPTLPAPATPAVTKADAKATPAKAKDSGDLKNPFKPKNPSEKK